MSTIDGREVDGVADLLLFLFRRGTPGTKAITRSLLCWLGWVLEASSFWGNASTDALVDAPVPVAARRARRLGRGLVVALARARDKVAV
eukprot:6189498-Lingulodinium_polyedra.AAC.1